MLLGSFRFTCFDILQKMPIWGRRLYKRLTGPHVQSRWNTWNSSRPVEAVALGVASDTGCFIGSKNC